MKELTDFPQGNINHRENTLGEEERRRKGGGENTECLKYFCHPSVEPVRFWERRGAHTWKFIY